MQEEGGGGGRQTHKQIDIDTHIHNHTHIYSHIHICGLLHARGHSLSNGNAMCNELLIVRWIFFQNNKTVELPSWSFKGNLPLILKIQLSKATHGRVGAFNMGKY